MTGQDPAWGLYAATEQLQNMERLGYVRVHSASVSCYEIPDAAHATEALSTTVAGTPRSDK